MESINSIFQRNIFVAQPNNYSSKQRTMLSLIGKDILADKNEANDEIASYIDILYKDTDENMLKKSDVLKLTGAYLPIKSQKLHYNNFLF